MAENYTRLWEAFLGGEYGDTHSPIGADAADQQYLEQTQDFYTEVVGPSFFGEERGAEFGESQFQGYLASFDPQVLQQAEETFRSAIGDPYAGDDPFSWEKISRYDTSGGIDSRVQQLLESELYGQGKFLGGETGADYGTATAKELETYTTGLTGEREALTYGELTSGASLASGTGGSVLRSGESASVAEDVLIEAYKKAKTLGADYRAGSEEIERDLEKDLNTALGEYLDTIDDEKSRWYDDVMRNVQTFRTMEMGDVTDWSDEAIADKLDTSVGYEEWDCGYGQKWNAVEGKCEDTTGEGGYEEKVAGYKFRTDAACGIGQIYQVTDEVTGEGECVTREDLDLTEDAYGYLCPPDDPGLQLCGECNAPIHTCWDGSTVCFEAECPPEAELVELQDTTCPEGQKWVRSSDVGGPGGFSGYCVDEDECVCPPGMPYNICHSPSGPCPDSPETSFEDFYETSFEEGLELGCGPGKPGPSVECPGGTLACRESDCPDDSQSEPLWKALDTNNCNRPENSCPEGKKCGITGICYTPNIGRLGKGSRRQKWGRKSKAGEPIGGA